MKAAALKAALEKRVPTFTPLATKKRDDLLITAAIMFVERGYLGTSIDDIAAALGSTKGRIYHHYDSKADLFLDVHLAALGMMIEQIKPIFEGDASPPEKMRAMTAEQLRTLMSPGPVQRAGLQGIQKKTLVLTTPRQKSAMRRLISMRDYYEDMFASVILAGIASGDFADRPARLLTKPLQGAINWTHVWFNPERRSSKASIQSMIDVIADFIVAGLRNTPAKPAPGRPGIKRRAKPVSP